MMLRNLRIGARLALGFGAIVLLLELAALGATLFGQASRDRLATLIERAGAREALAADTRALLLEQQSVMRNVGLRAEVKDMQADEDRANALGRRYQAAIAGLATSDLGGDEKAIVAALRDVNARLETPFREAIARATSFQSEAAAQVITGEIDPIVQKALAQWSRLIDLEKEANHAAIRDARVVGDRVARAVYAIEALVLVLSALLAWTVTRSITLPIGEAVSVARRVASGDLSSNIEPRGRDEAAELLGALAEMNRGLAQIVVHIRSGAESIAVGVNQVAAGNQQLSSRTEEHASSLEETASTLEEFTTTVRQNSEHANQASELAGSASATAQAGGELVSRVVTTMQEVTASSKRISDIIGVIDGISFQTNILALNAAVEAARAGEHGRGFAVVASEVRNLAQRSAASAKEIRGLIEDSVGRVESGARLVEQAGRTTDELVASVKRVAGIMSEIAAASREQSAGIEQINRAIAQMDNVVQMNASLVEEASAAATSMAAQASSLAGATARFRLDEASAPSSAAPRESGDRAAPAHARIAAPSPAPHAGEPPHRVRAVLALGNGEWKEF